MKRVAIAFCCLVCVLSGLREAMAFNFYFGEAGTPGVDEVHIGSTAIVIPLGNILLARKDSEYVAIKFTKFWAENTTEVGTVFVSAGSDLYALYESYCQVDKTGDFSKSNVQVKKDKLSNTKPRGIGRFALSFGRDEIECGNIKLLWSGEGSVHFYHRGQPMGDYGVELSPTKWMDISQVNVFDPRLKWYKFDTDGTRRRVNIPIN